MFMSVFRSTLVAIFVSALSLPAASKIAPELENARGTVNVIVQYRSAPKLTLIKTLKGIVGQVFDLTRMLTASLPVSSLTALANDPDVVYISSDRTLKANLDVAAGTVGATVAAQQGLTGAGVTVAVIDSGIDDHKDLKGRVVYQESFLPKLPLLGLLLAHGQLRPRNRGCGHSRR